MNARENAPRVSLGMPVYNGANFIREAIASLLEQTFRDFELIIVDNASTDDTEAICRGFAETDERIRFYRNSENIGAGKNFNLAVTYARGEYFKWAAHDDLCHPRFLEECVEVMDRNPDAALAYPKSRIIDAASNFVDSPYVVSEGTNDEDPVVRFKGLVKPHVCYQVFGLMRLSILRETPLIGLYARGDEILMCWLGLRGRFVPIDEFLFYPRKHEAQSMSFLGNRKRTSADFVAYSVWFDPNWRNRLVFPWWRSLRELIWCVLKAPISIGGKIRCQLVVLRWAISRKRSLLRDVVLQMKVLAASFAPARERSDKSPS
ncbi:glycosyltransferase family 2 protein [Pelagicoccus enzymogenes]|uniref:glycosyltransferase family 2 protein n=1 Tax=Pelagicoccus enzymogenes TaxID=2773457 RepID=UPI00280C921F|nr:glycosyltransferase family 2 protein [Pelagicoccus enzymogenes]MDQ8198899.1 glycosyltransferase family 2 protein [Pelagicoccus enzymogenes]